MKRIPASLLSVLFIAGCAPPQTFTPLPRPVDFNASTPHDVLTVVPPEQYQLLATLRFPAPIDAVIASSTRSEEFFSTLHVTDQRLTSSWSPAAEDSSPTLTFQLAQTVAIDAAAIKLSLGRTSSPSNQRVRVDVFASNDGGATWTQVVDDFRPQETTLDTVNFAPVLANTVRMTFAANAPDDISNLLVCEANIIDPILLSTPPSQDPPPSSSPTSSPSPASSPQSSPSTSPSSTPSSAPQPTPSPLPTSTPTPPTSSPPSSPPPHVPPAPASDGCYVNYGMGWLPKDGSRVEFGFMVQDQAEGFTAWPVMIQDHSNGFMAWGTVTRTVNIGNQIYLEGRLDDAARTPFVITATDYGEPSRNDTIAIWIGNSPTPYVSGTIGMGGGNIQAHAKDCDDPAVTGDPEVGRYF